MKVLFSIVSTTNLYKNQIILSRFGVPNFLIILNSNILIHYSNLNSDFCKYSRNYMQYIVSKKFIGATFEIKAIPSDAY